MKHLTKSEQETIHFTRFSRGVQQNRHGLRVEERQRVNGQPNGYRPISEAELQAERAMAEDRYV